MKRFKLVLLLSKNLLKSEEDVFEAYSVESALEDLGVGFILVNKKGPSLAWFDATFHFLFGEQLAQIRVEQLSFLADGEVLLIHEVLFVLLQELLV